ncbi:response regulator transcription factor [Gemella sp. GH3]|uniref:response regulator transcription factor n=1 Tax=unclassified Gemella TaxID=2624949 RepID=UPI0015CFFCAC|nr:MULTISPECIES: response regulator transcription factor [unclassified Gemella]MBF0713834.1 response regulator transcription factor [Gemella sp. GH3.1]NYS50786.1 response regulator transcription factor [Gemella sp. GH3]
MYKILVVEDDYTIANGIKEYLTKWNFQTKIIENFNSIIEKFIEFKPDLVLMDINLPHYDGYYYCEEIRKLAKTPIIFISSTSDDMNIVMAVTVGADDFVVKPFKLVVLKAKIDAILRRVYNFNTEHNLVVYKDVIFDNLKDNVSYKGKNIELTKNESKILELLFEHRENIVSRDDLMRYLWESDTFVDENTLSVNINRLRKKLETIGLVDFIITKKGRGYMI